MTRKDYALIATTIREKLNGYNAADSMRGTGTSSATYALEEMAFSLARAFLADNPKFDFGLFVTAATGRMA